VDPLTDACEVSCRVRAGWVARSRTLRCAASPQAGPAWTAGPGAYLGSPAPAYGAWRDDCSRTAAGRIRRCGSRGSWWRAVLTVDTEPGGFQRRSGLL